MIFFLFLYKLYDLYASFKEKDRQSKPIPIFLRSFEFSVSNCHPLPSTDPVGGLTIGTVLHSEALLFSILCFFYVIFLMSIIST